MCDVPDTEEARLERLRLHLETVQRIADLGSWEADVDTGELRWSSNVYAMLGIPETVAPDRQRFIEAVHPDDRGRIIEAQADALAGRAPYSVDHRIVLPDGTVRHVHEEAVAEVEDGRTVRLIGTMQDITDQMVLTQNLVETESRRRELLHRMVRASEHERAQLAGDLHDGPIQMLTVTAMRLEHLGMVDPDPPAWLPEALQTVRDTVVQLRDVLVELHPRAGAGAGLDATLTELALTIVPDLDVEVVVTGEATDLETRAIFGIVQEVLWDIRGSDRTRHLDIAVDVGSDEVELSVTGALAEASAGDGLLGRAGMLGARERTEGFGGRCTVERREDQPAVRCVLPRQGDGAVADG